MKNRLILLSVLIVTTSSASGYFEWKYQCSIQSGNITVSLNSGTQKCFDYLSAMESSISQLDIDISQASDFIVRGNDTSYRNQVLATLNKEKSSLLKTKSQTLVAISDFERSLFNQIKSLLGFYLSDQRDDILRSVERVRIQIIQSRDVGNELSFRSLNTTMEGLQYKLFLLDRIQFAHDFEEMVPFLKEYLYGNGL